MTSSNGQQTCKYSERIQRKMNTPTDMNRNEVPAEFSTFAWQLCRYEEIKGVHTFVTFELLTVYLWADISAK